MARLGITYEEVAAAAESITANGEHPSIQAIRNQLGTGSPNTIHKHLKRWRESRPAQLVAAIELPKALTQALHDVIHQAASSARAETQLALAEAQAEADELSSEGELLETERDTLLDQVKEITVEHDRQRLLLEQQDQSITKHLADIKREQEAAELARIETAKSRVELEQLRKMVTDLNEQLKASTAALESAKSEAVEAKQQAAVAITQTESERARAADLAQRLVNTEKNMETALKAAREASEAAATYRGQLQGMTDYLAKETKNRP